MNSRPCRSAGSIHAKSWLHAAFGELLRQVEYKALWSSQRFVQVGRFFPSTKLVLPGADMRTALRPGLDLSRSATHHMIRDFNSAKNVKSEVLTQVRHRCDN